MPSLCLTEVLAQISLREVSLILCSKYFGIHTFPKIHAFRVLLTLFPCDFFLPVFSLTLEVESSSHSDVSCIIQPSPQELEQATQSWRQMSKLIMLSWPDFVLYT